MRIPGQPQLLGLVTTAAVDPRPALTPLPAAPVRRQARCDSCDAPVAWGMTAGGKRCPYDVDEHGNKTTSHFGSCPHARSHSKKQPTAKKVAA